jgi:hypothetical protein
LHKLAVCLEKEGLARLNELWTDNARTRAFGYKKDGVKATQALGNLSRHELNDCLQLRDRGVERLLSRRILPVLACGLQEIVDRQLGGADSLHEPGGRHYWLLEDGRCFALAGNPGRHVPRGLPNLDWEIGRCP